MIGDRDPTTDDRRQRGLISEWGMRHKEKRSWEAGTSLFEVIGLGLAAGRIDN